MILRVTDGESLEKSGHTFHDIGELSATADETKMKIWAGEFVERVLEFNPDATEQIDIMDKHLACAENLGEQARKKNAALAKALQDTGADIAKIFQQPAPAWLNGILSGITRSVTRLKPGSQVQDSSAITRVREYIPRIATPLKRYFMGFEDARTDLDTLVKSMDKTLAWQEKNAIRIDHQMEELKSHSASLAKAIRLGRLIDQTLCEALVREVPRGDSRKTFISDHLLLRLRLRIDILRLQMELNRRSLITLELIRRNSEVLVCGIQQVKDTLIRTFNHASNLALALTHRRIILGPLAEDPAPQQTPDDTSEHHGLAHLKRDFAELLAHEKDITTFLSGCLPIVQAALETVEALRRQADEALVNLTTSGKQALIGDIMDMD